MATTPVTARCACGAFEVTVVFPNDSLPIERALCLCNGCRHVTGSCASSTITIPQSQAIEPSDFNLTAYKTSNNFNRYFCSTCGAHILGKRIAQETCHLSTGIWSITEGIIKWTGCKWVEDTLDGGISVWLKDIDDGGGERRRLKRWLLQAGADGELVPDGALRTLPANSHVNRGENLKAQCHCGGVKFYITRPDEASKKVTSPYPNLMVPYHERSSLNPNNETWWLQEHNSKYLAGTCTCASCRLASGTEIQPWAFIPRYNIFQQDGAPLDFNMGTLKSYASSEGVFRNFCRVCGATVFWHCEWRPDLMDVSVGLFDPEDGARAEEWLSWWKGRVSFGEMSVSRCLVSSLEAGMRSEIGLKEQDVEKVG